MDEQEYEIYASLEDVVDSVEYNIDLESNSIDTANEFVEDEIGRLVDFPKKKKTFPCLICFRKFSQNAGRYNHMKKVHNILPGAAKAQVKCLEKGCLFTCTYKEKLQLHLSEQHGIDMDVNLKTFDSVQDFLRWKDEFERQEKSRFVKKSGSRTREEGMRVAYYYCNRSGTYVSKGMKRSKRMGTSKSSHHCTASITCLERSDGKVDVKICSTHYGHDHELHHLRLTQTEKFQIAEQISQGLPRELVLDNVRASAGSDVDRIHLITIKDIKNIEKMYGICANSNEKTDNMFFNLKVWAGGIKRSEHSPVLYFKEEGVPSTNPEYYDMTLILLTTSQLEVLQKYACSGNAIFFVSTFEEKGRPSNNNSKPTTIHITTLVLVGDFNEAVPVSFMVSNMSNNSKFMTFFQSLKNCVPDMTAKVVLTDDKEEIFNAWCSVFVEKPCHLWSNRYVDSDWRENLMSITDEEVQDSVYEKLYYFLESHDSNKLESTLKPYANELQSNVVTKKFGDYFLSKYIGTECFWAGCYGKRFVRVSSQLNMEFLCNEIEEIGRRKHWDKNLLVRIVQRLLKLVNEKQCQRQSRLQKQVQELITHHKLALNIKPETISHESEFSWRVSSVKDPKNIFSDVSLENHKCEPAKCMLFCSKCCVCIHEFQCSCKVYAFDKTMCKHIHAVALNFIFKKSEQTDYNEESLGFQSDPEREIKNPELLILKESLWRKARESGKKKRKLPVEESQEHHLEGEDSLLPIIEKVLRDNVPIKKSKHEKQANQTTLNSNESEDITNNRKWKRKKRKLDLSVVRNDYEQETIKNKEDSSSVRKLRNRKNKLKKCH